MDPLQQSELCLVCFRYHPLRFCKQFKKMTLQQRKYIVRVHRYCANCFARTHLIGGCTSMEVCQVCGDLHHTMLHPQQQQPQRQRRQQQQPQRQRSQQQQQPPRQRRQQQQSHRQRRQQLQQQPQRQRRHQQLQSQRQRRLQQQQPSRRQRRLQPQQQPIQRSRRQLQQQQSPQLRRRQQPVRRSAQAVTAPEAQGLVQQIVSALDQLSGVLNIAPVQGGDNVEDRLSENLIDLD